MNDDRALCAVCVLSRRHLLRRAKRRPKKAHLIVVPLQLRAFCGIGPTRPFFCQRSLYSCSLSHSLTILEFSFCAIYCAGAGRPLNSPYSFNIIYVFPHMATVSSSVPRICISPPHQEEPSVEDRLSVLSLTYPAPAQNSVIRGGVHLDLSSRRNVGGGLSPLRPVDVPVTGKGLERERFEALLRASKERNAALGGKKDVDLRKEIALKAHKTKQGMGPSLFLLKRDFEHLHSS